MIACLARVYYMVEEQYNATQDKKRTVSHFQAGVDPVPNLDWLSHCLLLVCFAGKMECRLERNQGSWFCFFMCEIYLTGLISWAGSLCQSSWKLESFWPVSSLSALWNREKQIINCIVGVDVGPAPSPFWACTRAAGGRRGSSRRQRDRRSSPSPCLRLVDVARCLKFWIRYNDLGAP